MTTTTMQPARLSILTLGVTSLPTSTAFYESKLCWPKTAASNANISFFQLSNGMLLSLFPVRELEKDAFGDSSNASASLDASTTTTNQGQQQQHDDDEQIRKPSFKGFTMAYNCQSKQEVDQTLNDLRVKGVSIVKEAQEVFWGGYSGYFSDPDGHLWEVAYNPFLPLDAQGHVVAVPEDEKEKEEGTGKE